MNQQDFKKHITDLGLVITCENPYFFNAKLKGVEFTFNFNEENHLISAYANYPLRLDHARFDSMEFTDATDLLTQVEQAIYKNPLNRYHHEVALRHQANAAKGNIYTADANAMRCAAMKNIAYGYECLANGLYDKARECFIDSGVYAHALYERSLHVKSTN